MLQTSLSVVEAVLGKKLPAEGGTIKANNIDFVVRDGVLRQSSLLQKEDPLAEFYGLHWRMPGAYDDAPSFKFQLDLFKVMFPDFQEYVKKTVKADDVVFDIGCGSGIAGRAYFGDSLRKTKYVAIDMSLAIEQAKQDFAAEKMTVGLVQATIESLPFPSASADFVFCPGVLHYTPDMPAAFKDLSKVLKKGGRIIAWIYQRQKPIRQATDDCIRSIVSKMGPEEAFEAMKPLTKLGIALGELKQTIDVPEDIPFLEIKAGKYDLQRFFYYHFMKLFYNPELPFTRHVVNNWNAYFPAHVLFHSKDELRSMIKAAGLEVELFNDQGNGVALIARKL